LTRAFFLYAQVRIRLPALRARTEVLGAHGDATGVAVFVVVAVGSAAWCLPRWV
jgi:hypothetical protein